MALIDGLQAYWKFDESSGDANDSTSGSKTATNVNTTAYATAKINNGADLESTLSNYFSVTDGTSVRVVNGWSVSFWCNSKSQPTGGVGFPMYILSQRSVENGWGVGVMTDTGPTYKFTAWAGSGAFGNVLSTQEVSLSTWYHVVVYFNGTNTKMYVNNGSPMTLTGLSTITNANNGLHIGKNQTGSSGYYDGLFDEFGIWNRELIASDVSELYNDGAGFSYPFSVGGNMGYLKKNVLRPAIFKNGIAR